MTTKQAKQKRQNRLGTVLAILIFLLGLGILFYPVASDLWNQHRQNQLISHYTQSTTTLAPEDHSALWEAAQEYNKNLSPTFRDAFTGRGSCPRGPLLGPAGSRWQRHYGLHRDPAHQRAAAHLPRHHGGGPPAWHRASRRYLPAGGWRGHPRGVFRHRGLPSALLFSDLDQMQLGDHFSLRILGEQLLYEVDQILVVEPDEVKDLYPVEGEDLVTLVTCTPYGVNTHRLLVRGHRIPLETVEETVEVTVTQQVVHSLGWKGKLLIGALLLFLLILLSCGCCAARKRKPGPKRASDRKGEN